MLLVEGERNPYVDAHRDLIIRARAFDGCVDLAITADAVDPRRVNTVEVWDSAEVLDAWRTQANPPHTGIEPTDVHVRSPRRRAALLKTSKATSLRTS